MLSLTIETSQPNGAKFRLAFECNLYSVVSWITGLFR